MKIICLIAAAFFLTAGWLGWHYQNFQIKFDALISAKNFSAAQDALNDWEKSKANLLLSNFSRIKQELAFKKGWLAAQSGNTEEALKEFRKAASHASSLNAEAIYNAATLGLAGGRESLEKLAEDYILALKKNPNDFQTKVNLEIIRIIQNQQKQEMRSEEQSAPGKKGKKKIRQLQMDDNKNREGQESGESDQGVRY